MFEPILSIDPYNQSLVGFFMLVVPAALYALGIYEERKFDWLFGAGLLAHLLSIAERWAYTGLIPLSDKHDNVSLAAFTMAGLYFYLRRRGKAANLAPFAIPLICAAIIVSMGLRTVNSITPFMHTPWFYLHVLFYFTAYGWLGISSTLYAQYFLSGDASHEAQAHKLASTGWIMLSASLMFGSIWFYLAYGTYWLWTSKELWITVTWLYYGALLHARLINKLRGRTLAVLGVIAFVAAVFTYFGVGTVIKSPPTQF